MTEPKRRTRTDKTERQEDQRRRSRERQQREELKRRAEQPDALPVRDDEGLYRP